MRHANELLSKMDFSLHGAIAHTSNMFVVEGSGEVPYTTFECWKTGESKELGNVKTSADGVFVRLEEMQSQKMIHLSELPLAGKIRIYTCKRVGTSSQPLSAGGRKRVRPQNDGGEKKSVISFEELDVSKGLLKWTKPELEAYLIHQKTGNKLELIRCIQEHMATSGTTLH